MAHILTLYKELPAEKGEQDEQTEQDEQGEQVKQVKQWEALKHYAADTEPQLQKLMQSTEFIENAEKMGATHWEETLARGVTAEEYEMVAA